MEQTTLHAMQLPNVHKPLKPITDELEVRVYPKLEKVIKELALKNPLWQFKATTASSNNGMYLYCTAFDVYSQSELLGSIRRTYTYRLRDHIEAISVHSRSIEKSMSRKNHYVTADQDKAIAKVRKEFAPRNRMEKVKEASNIAESCINMLLHGRNREDSRLSIDIQRSIMDFYLETTEGFEVFMAHLEKNNKVDVIDKVRAKQEVTLEIMTIANVKDKLGKAGTALVVLDEGKYLVKVLDVVQLYDDTSLPEQYRGKLGMLKLVGENQFVKGAGYRVNTEVFVIDLDQPQE